MAMAIMPRFSAKETKPSGTRLEPPIVLFAVADELSLLYELDRACAHAAIRNAAQLEPVHRVFINRLPQAFHDPTFLDDDVPALDKKTCYQVMPPTPGFTGDVFAVKNTTLAKELDKHLGWDVTQAAAVVELQWRKDDRFQWVEMTDLIQLNWRNVEPETVTAKVQSRTQPTEPASVKAQAVE